MSSSLFSGSASQNPQARSNEEKINIVKALIGSRDPKTVFYEECEKRGVDPQSILKKIK